MNTFKNAMLCTTAALVFLAPNISSSDNHHTKSPVFKSTQLTDNIYMLQGKGGNLGLLKGKDGLLLIDADYKVMSEALKTELAKHGGIEKLSYLINTHWHGDHTQGNDALGHHAQIVAHDNVRKRLTTTQEIKLFKMVSKPYPEHALPSLTYATRMSMHINGEELTVMEIPLCFSKNPTSFTWVTIFFQVSFLLLI